MRFYLFFHIQKFKVRRAILSKKRFLIALTVIRVLSFSCAATCKKEVACRPKEERRARKNTPRPSALTRCRAGDGRQGNISCRRLSQAPLFWPSFLRLMPFRQVSPSFRDCAVRLKKTPGICPSSPQSKRRPKAVSRPAARQKNAIPRKYRQPEGEMTAWTVRKRVCKQEKGN